MAVVPEAPAALLLYGVVSCAGACSSYRAAGAAAGLQNANASAAWAGLRRPVFKHPSLLQICYVCIHVVCKIPPC